MPDKPEPVIRLLVLLLLIPLLVFLSSYKRQCVGPRIRRLIQALRVARKNGAVASHLQHARVMKVASWGFCSIHVGVPAK